MIKDKVAPTHEAHSIFLEFPGPEIIFHCLSGPEAYCKARFECGCEDGSYVREPAHTITTLLGEETIPARPACYDNETGETHYGTWIDDCLYANNVSDDDYDGIIGPINVMPRYEDEYYTVFVGDDE